MTDDTRKAVREHLECALMVADARLYIKAALRLLDTEASQGEAYKCPVCDSLNGECCSAIDGNGPGRGNREAKLEAELHSERIQSERLIECHERQSAILASLQDREAKLVEALEKIAKAELWSHGHHVRLDATTIQEVPVFAAATLAKQGEGKL
jgi:hypothetical protein